MIKQLRHIIIVLILSTAVLSAQDEADRPAVGLEILSHNMLKFNKHIINPAFSFVGEKQASVSMYHRRQWGAFNEFPQFYYLGYSGTIGDKMGLGIGAFQHNVGVFSNTGAILNYSYSAQLSRDSYLTFGINTSVYTSGINASKINSYQEDPTLANLQNSFIISAQPGVNFSIGKFDIGIYAENIFDYNVSTSEMLTEFGEKTFSGHLQYTYDFERLSGIFENARLISLLRARKFQEETSIAAGFLFDVPDTGWFQLGYESIYGASAGVGYILLNSLSLGYAVEKGFGDGLKDFGLTHEFTLAYSFTQVGGNRTSSSRSRSRRTVRRRPITRPTAPVVKTPPPPVTQEEPVVVEETPPVSNQPTVADVLNAKDAPVSEETPPIIEEEPVIIEEVPEPPVVEEEPVVAVKEPEIPVSEEDSLSVARATITKENEEVIKELVRARKDFVNEEDLEEIALEKAKELYGVKRDKSESIEGVQSGYYIISNTYITERYLNASLSRLREEGMDANYFYNPNDELNYVYLGRFDNMEEVLEYYKNNQEIAFNNRTTVYKVEDDDQSQIVKGKENTTEVSQVIEVPDMESGYYMVTHVFAIPENAEVQIEKMKKQGLNVKSFVNPKNLYIYIYLENHSTFEEAEKAYQSNLNNTYDREVLIMSVNQE
ncbi:PorP/SprF family type IX secretion system membrane protein [Abyssalbus ytuae]|uniref:PorP/SprF family type IX secretion system membrane protein n=1 Tax=Abyssalbus ytuae TaxID=2926907 RepID=A0A9E7D1F8_9FLAO|nr:PorP/SprF family type IX secretion system membrane protein [Abyssalbus ytuae]UOB19285.1 PorP/SprF family type IX secretion system membrane protein [Abyssalbus ytuae]